MTAAAMFGVIPVALALTASRLLAAVTVTEPGRCQG